MEVRGDISLPSEEEIKQIIDELIGANQAEVFFFLKTMEPLASDGVMY